MKLGKIFVTTIAGLSLFGAAALAETAAPASSTSMTLPTEAEPREYFCETEDEGLQLTLKAFLKPTGGTGGDLTYELEGLGLFQLTEGRYASFSETKRVYINPRIFTVRAGKLRFPGTDPHDSFYLTLPGPLEKPEARFTRDRMIVNHGGIRFQKTVVPMSCR